MYPSFGICPTIVYFWLSLYFSIFLIHGGGGGEGVVRERRGGSVRSMGRERRGYGRVRKDRVERERERERVCERRFCVL